ncbi:MAG: AMP-binding protein [Candidatus Eisenbacteria bacterium]
MSLGVPRDASTLPEMIERAALLYAERPAFAWRAEGAFQSLSYRGLRERVVALATALIDLGVVAGESVALLSDNRLEWIVANLAIQYVGAVDVPRGSEVTLPELTHILPHSDARFCFVEDAAMAERVERLGLASPPRLIRMAGVELREGELRLARLLHRGESLRAAGDRRVEARIATLGPDDPYALIYTSGTTGTPKGVLLTQRNILSQVRNIPLALSPRDRVLSILPVWHSYERMFEMVCLSLGAATYYGSVRTLADDFRQVRPTFMASAPRLWESLHARIEHRVRSSGPARRGLSARRSGSRDTGARRGSFSVAAPSISRDAALPQRSDWEAFTCCAGCSSRFPGSSWISSCCGNCARWRAGACAAPSLAAARYRSTSMSS